MMHMTKNATLMFTFTIIIVFSSRRGQGTYQIKCMHVQKPCAICARSAGGVAAAHEVAHDGGHDLAVHLHVDQRLWQPPRQWDLQTKLVWPTAPTAWLKPVPPH